MQPVEYLPGYSGVLCVSWEVFVSTASRGSSRALHNSMRAAFAVVLTGLVHLRKLQAWHYSSFQAWHHCEMSVEWYLWSVVCRDRSVRLATALLVSDGAIQANTGRLFMFGLQTACDHSTGFIQCRVQFLCMGGVFPHRASICLLCS